MRAGLLLLPCLLAAQPLRPGPQILTFRSSADGSEQPYALYLPKAPDAQRRYPLVVSLHAEETNHRANLIQLLGVGPRPGDSLGAATGFPPLRDAGYAAACPFARGTMGYGGVAERDVYDMLADVQRRLAVDPDRIYLTGVSMGGNGALWLALTRPDVWAAAAPVSAEYVVSPELAPNALNLPIRIFHGEQDPRVPAASARDLHKLLLDAGDPAEYVEYPGARHNAWDFAYAGGSLFEWFSRFRRNPAPERVRLVALSYRYRSAYWVRIDGLTPGTPAFIDARLAGRGEAEIETRNVDGFSIVGESAPALTRVRIDGAALRLRPGQALSFERAGGRWRSGLFRAAGKRPGAEGPIAEALADRHIYVYGTADHPPPDVLETRRRAAERAARWSTLRARITFAPAVKADSALTPADIDGCNLVLFGGRSSNSAIARLAGELPLELEPSAADWGLVFIFPVGGRYVVVNSGLPLWNLEQAPDLPLRGTDPFAPWQFRLAGMFGDFVLFKGSAAHVVLDGRFDRNWKVPPDASARMLATGTVAIHK